MVDIAQQAGLTLPMVKINNGDKFNKLTYIGATGKRSRDKHIIGLFECECGKQKEIIVSRVTSGYIKSCGCLVRDTKPSQTHGMRYTPEYRHWQSMRSRCNNPNNKDFPKYSKYKHGDVLESFEAFYSEIGAKPGHDYSVDRINNNLGYVSGNIRWATRPTQQRNASSSYYVKIHGIVYDCYRDAADAHGVSLQTVHKWCNGYNDRGKIRGKKEWAEATPKYKNIK